MSHDAIPPIDGAAATGGGRSAAGRFGDRFARVTTSGRRIRELDGLRFLAIGSVVVLHVCQVVVANEPGRPRMDRFARLVFDSRIGVDLFFVISGFILALPFGAHRLLGERPVPLRSYYLRRLTRLEPPYLLTLALWYAVAVLYWHRPAAALWPHVLASAAYVHNLVYFNPATGDYTNPISNVAWSLEVEVQFYLLAPLLAAIAFAPRRPAVRRWGILAVAVAVGQSSKLFLHRHVALPPTLYGELPNCLMGFLLADVFLTDWDQRPPRVWWADVVAVGGWLLLPFWFQDLRVHGHRVVPQGGLPEVLLVLCYASFRGRWTSRFLASGPVMTLGGMCYSIYLLHLPILHLLGDHPQVLWPGRMSVGLRTLVDTAVWMAVVLPASALFFVAVEKPCMRRDWPRRAWGRLTGRPRSMDGPLPALPGPPDAAAAEAFLDVPVGAVSPLSENQPVP